MIIKINRFYHGQNNIELHICNEIEEKLDNNTMNKIYKLFTHYLISGKYPETSSKVIHLW